MSIMKGTRRDTHDKGILHCYPVYPYGVSGYGDQRPHVLRATTCWCKPQVEVKWDCDKIGPKQYSYVMHAGLPNGA